MSSPSHLSSLYDETKKTLKEIRSLCSPVKVDWSGRIPSEANFQRRHLEELWLFIDYKSEEAEPVMYFLPLSVADPLHADSITLKRESIVYLPLWCIVSQRIGNVPPKKAVTFAAGPPTANGGDVKQPSPQENGPSACDADEDDTEDLSSIPDLPRQVSFTTGALPQVYPTTVFGRIALIMEWDFHFIKGRYGRRFGLSLLPQGRDRLRRVTVLVPSYSIVERLSVLFDFASCAQTLREIACAQPDDAPPTSVIDQREHEVEIDTSVVIEKFLHAKPSGDEGAADEAARSSATRYGAIGPPPSNGNIFITFDDAVERCRRVRVPPGALFIDPTTGKERFSRIDIGPATHMHRIEGISFIPIDLTLSTEVGGVAPLTRTFYIQQVHDGRKRRLHFSAATSKEKLEWVIWFLDALGQRSRERAESSSQRRMMAELIAREAPKPYSFPTFQFKDANGHRVVPSVRSASVVSPPTMLQRNLLLVDLVSAKERFGPVILFNGSEDGIAAKVGCESPASSFDVTALRIAALDVRDIKSFVALSPLSARIHMVYPDETTALHLDGPLSRLICEGLFSLHFLDVGAVEEWTSFWADR